MHEGIQPSRQIEGTHHLPQRHQGAPVLTLPQKVYEKEYQGLLRKILTDSSHFVNKADIVGARVAVT